MTHVKISEGTVSSPLIEEGDADVIIAFEELEAYRWLPYLKKGGTIYVNTQKILADACHHGQGQISGAHHGNSGRTCRSC